MEDWQDKLGQAFPGWNGSTVPKIWPIARAELEIDQSVDGVVVAQAPFGVWLDIGVRIPALLLVTNFADAATRRYKPEDYPAVGESLTCRIVRLTDRGQISLVQVTPRPEDSTATPEIS